VFLQSDGKQYLVVPELELGRARRETESSAFRDHYPNADWDVEVFSPKTLGIEKQRQARLSAWAQKVIQKANVNSVIVLPQFPYGIARKLEKMHIKLTAAKEELFPERAVKTADELRKIRQAQQAAVIAMRTAIAAIADSEIDRDGFLRAEGKAQTSERIRRVIEKALIEHDCFCRDIIVAGGVQGADPHEMGEGPLRAHEAIVIDIFPQHLKHGYWGDLTRTVVRGRANARLKRMYSAVRAAQSAALSAIRPGVKSATVHGCAVAEFKRRKFATGAENGRPFGFIHSTGHGVGLAIHEAPSVGRAEGRLKSGNVITVEPGLYYPDIGGIRIEDTVVVTSQGWRYLVPCEKRLEV
jgi:Xaa-Pro aminopeptidase